MNECQRFKDKVVIVTGAAQGIGRGVAIQLAAEGALLVMADISPLLEDVHQEIQVTQGQATPIIADMESYAGAEAVVAKALELYGRVDILINNVGGAIWMKPFVEFSEQEIIKEVSRSLFPTLWGCRAVLPYMIEQQHGVIVNVSSIATCGIHRIPYSASKGGVNSMTKSLAFAHAKDGIRVNAVATGGTDAPPRKIPRNSTPLTQQEKDWMQDVVDQTIDRSFMHRYGSIQEQVNAILFLASDEASYVTGTVLPVGGGDQG
ncbi:benzoate diol dehydrogenase BenD [Acinetobacter lanii]|uniref:1,6-dihydroxycyclohexa-2,4-diene-1-carboxylate dehydrogenase n=1 Tax=Acinetobacter lanii TaxID=2715163 RepID=A0A6G8S4H4_9GAMM|nr:benzoate diol dehydrogenase BenD [Acinetobacter lanii]QIO09045.1 1,6-dihydroxycyclohexa-2,4-diene-1-carboxylate dehydrogenase [Acinetobacter lanii]